MIVSFKWWLCWIYLVIIFPRNVSFREYYVFVSNAAATASQFRCQRDNFEGFKLRSSNLTHALLIQISRTSSIIDIVVPSKMAAGGHFVKKIQKKVAYRSEMASNVIESYLRTSKMAAGGHFVQNLKKYKVPYGSEIARNAIESEFRTSKMADQSEIARNAIQSDFQIYKMAAEKK